MSWPTVALGDVFDVERGGSPRPIDQYITDDDDGLNWVMISDATASGKVINSTKKKIRPEGLKKTRQVYPGDFILSNSMSFGRPYIMGIEGCIHDGWLLMRPKDGRVDPDYFYHLLGSSDVYNSFESRAAGATVKNLNSGIVREVKIPLPPLEEQKRIAGILDQADALRRLRTRAHKKLNTLGQAIFHEMFGNPAANPKGWPKSKIRDAVAEISDGPFGSNLKSAHYTETGVRVWRLQNIGIGHLVDKDRAYISAEHFQTLRKHECIPGDVLVGTMGNPNLRACIQPAWLKTALNKADCVKIRPDKTKALSAFWNGLLNHPSTLEIAQSAVLGQTRARISMGRLRELRVPLPPTKLQEEYVVQIENIEKQKDIQIAAIALEESLFISLQHRAFRGEL